MSSPSKVIASLQMMSLKFCRAPARRGEKFEWIVLDPPTFSRRHKGRIWRLEIDYGRLIEMARACASPGAMILLSANCSSFDTGKLKALGRRSLGYNPTFPRA